MASRRIQHVAEGSYAWYNMAVGAEDQLRQKVAWALSQQFVISGDSFAGTHVLDEEHWVTYYDIFVRHAFGNLRDILREVSFSPMMGSYLTFKNSGSYYSTGTWPDENYAREFMQLFSIGLYQLNSDGTRKQDADGNDLETYTNNDIMNFARAWTGFKGPRTRPNLEGRASADGGSLKDPMVMVASSRDLMPKTDVKNGYIGDLVPVCADRPDKAFLRTGAKYVYRGWSETICKGYAGYNGPVGFGCAAAGLSKGRQNVGDFGHIDLAPAGSLYQRLCQPDESGDCTFPSEIVLDVNVLCNGLECTIEDVQQVRVATETEAVFYEYVPAPCVDMTFYPNPMQLNKGWNIMCADPRSAAGSIVCCNEAGTTNTPGLALCEYNRERATHAGAQQRCRMTPDVDIVDIGMPNGWQLGYANLPADDAAYFTAKDRRGAGAPSVCELSTNLHDVRCCSDTSREGFTQPGGIANASLAANVALGRPVTMSSRPGWGAVAGVATDGNTDQNYNGGSCFHSGNDADNTWWQVDLGSPILLSQVNVYNRGDAAAGRISGAKIYVSSTADYTATGTACGARITRELISEVPCSLEGQFVTVVKESGGWMHLCEVEILAATTEVCSAVSLRNSSSCVVSAFDFVGVALRSRQTACLGARECSIIHRHGLRPVEPSTLQPASQRP